MQIVVCGFVMEILGFITAPTILDPLAVYNPGSVTFYASLILDPSSMKYAKVFVKYQSKSSSSARLCMETTEATHPLEPLRRFPTPAPAAATLAFRTNEDEDEEERTKRLPLIPWWGRDHGNVCSQVQLNYKPRYFQRAE